VDSKKRKRGHDNFEVVNRKYSIFRRCATIIELQLLKLNKIMRELYFLQWI
jgi:hypothetical protein